MELENLLNRGQVQHFRRTVLAVFLLSSQLFVLFPILIWGKLYIYSEIGWICFLPFPLLAGVCWGIMIPSQIQKSIGFICTCLILFWSLSQDITMLSYHLSFLPFFVTFVNKNDHCPFGLLFSLQCHLEGFISFLYENKITLDKTFTICDWKLSVYIRICLFIFLFIGISILPVALFSFLYLVHQMNECTSLLLIIWLCLGIALSLNSVCIMKIPISLVLLLVILTGLCITTESFICYIDWRCRLIGLSSIQHVINENVSLTVPNTAPRIHSDMTGLSMEEITKIPVVRYEDIKKDEESTEQHIITDTVLCTVCQDHLISPDCQILVLPKCKHTFHSHCLMVWLKQKPLCPNCNCNIRHALYPLEDEFNVTHNTLPSGNENITLLSQLFHVTSTWGISLLPFSFINRRRFPLSHIQPFRYEHVRRHSRWRTQHHSHYYGYIPPTISNSLNYLPERRRQTPQSSTQNHSLQEDPNCISTVSNHINEQNDEIQNPQSSTPDHINSVITISSVL